MMKLSRVLKRPEYLGLALLISAAFFMIYAYIQTRGIAENFLFWLGTIPPANSAVFLLFAAVIGVSSSYQIYLFREPKACSLKGAGATSAVGIGGLFVSACPACASFGLFVLPVNVLAFISGYGIYINLLGIALLLFMIRYLGGFEE